MSDLKPRKLVTLKRLLDTFKVSKETVDRSWKPRWTLGAHYVVIHTKKHLYDPILIEHWLTYGTAYPALHQKAIENTLSRLDQLHTSSNCA